MIDITGNHHRVSPHGPGSRPHHCGYRRQAVSQQHRLPRLNRESHPFFRQRERNGRLLGFPSRAQHGHMYQLAHAAPFHLPVHLADWHLQRELPVGIGINRIQRLDILARTVGIEPTRHRSLRRHAPATQRSAIVVHGLAGQIKGVAKMAAFLRLVQPDFKRRTFIFLHDEIHHALPGLHHIPPGHSGGRQSKRSRESAHFVTLHRLFGHRLSIRVTKFQRDFPTFHRHFIPMHLIRTQTAHIYRLSRPIDCPVSI